MAASVVNTKTILTLAPGQSETRHWNKAAPSGAVWSANAIPWASPEDAKFEITRLWRRERVALTSGTPLNEHEIYYTVKNIGSQEGNCVVWLGIVS